MKVLNFKFASFILSSIVVRCCVSDNLDFMIALRRI